MKRQVRRGVFETNSSSVHSITMCTQETYSKWEKGEVFYNKYNESFKTKDEVIEELKNKIDFRTGDLKYSDVDWNDDNTVLEIMNYNNYVTESEFWDDIDYETFYESLNGVVAFGYYGENR